MDVSVTVVEPHDVGSVFGFEDVVDVHCFFIFGVNRCDRLFFDIGVLGAANEVLAGEAEEGCFALSTVGDGGGVVGTQGVFLVEHKVADVCDQVGVVGLLDKDMSGIVDEEGDFHDLN